MRNNKVFNKAATLMLLICMLGSTIGNAVADGAEGDDKKNIEKAEIKISKRIFEYTGKPCILKVKVILDGKTLKKDVDYTLEYQENIEVGKAFVVIEAIGEYHGIRIEEFQIKESPKHDISNAKILLSKYSYVYSGRRYIPKATVIIDDKVLTRGKDYKVYYSSNRNTGFGVVMVAGIGKYKGSKDVNFVILPDKTYLKPLKRGRRRMIIRWSKVKGADGYTVYFRKAGEKRYKALKTVKGNKYRFVHRRLKKGRRYFYRVRAFFKDSQHRYYGALSNLRYRKAR